VYECKFDTRVKKDTNQILIYLLQCGMPLIDRLEFLLQTETKMH